MIPQHLAALAALAVWGGFCWRARGGGVADVLHNRLGGTDTTRALFGMLMVMPLCLINWHAVVLWPAEFLSWKLSGWGPFQDMGGDQNSENPSWAGWLVEHVGIRSPMWHDFVGMVLIGLTCMTLPAVAVAWLHGWVVEHALAVWASGAAFAPCYVAGDRLPFPPLGRFCSGQEWRETLVGAWVLPILAWGCW